MNNVFTSFSSSLNEQMDSIYKLTYIQELNDEYLKKKFDILRESEVSEISYVQLKNQLLLLEEEYKKQAKQQTPISQHAIEPSIEEEKPKYLTSSDYENKVRNNKISPFKEAFHNIQNRKTNEFYNDMIKSINASEKNYEISKLKENHKENFNNNIEKKIFNITKGFEPVKTKKNRKKRGQHFTTKARKEREQQNLDTFKLVVSNPFSSLKK